MRNPFYFISGVFLLACSSSSIAAGDAHYRVHLASVILVEQHPYTAPSNAQLTEPSPAFEPPLWSRNNAHLYLGLATIVAAVATAATAPGSCDQNCPNPAPPREVNGTHAQLAQATIGLAAATIATGIWAHWDDFYLEDGITDPDNLHVLLGVSGAALMAYAVNKSLSSSVKVSHAGEAELGAALMLVGIKLVW
jgi:hypothetical protein